MAMNNTNDNGKRLTIPDKDSVICVENVTKNFGGELAVREVTFDVPRASIFGFIGPSGSGKTTTVRLLTGIYVPTIGNISVLNIDPSKFSQDQRARIGYMPQLFVLYPNLTVWENINFAASLYGMSLVRSRRLKQILEFVELYEHRHKLTHNISGGMQRRLSLAAALIHDPELMFLDEPTTGIDPILRQKFWEHFKELQSQGRTMFITTQYVNEADNCDLVGLMSNGKLLKVDTPRGLRHQAFGGDIIDICATEPIDAYTEQLLRSVSLKTIRTSPNSIRIIVNDASTAIPDLMEWAPKNNLRVETLEQFTPPFDDVFVELVRSEVNND
jgi:ABC-2 type transport system ATP-binding protein